MEILGGPLFGVAGAGESHGPAVTTIVFGCPPGLKISRVEVQSYLDRRRPGGNKHGTPRNEKDKVVFLSGLYQDDHDALTDGPTIHIEVEDNQFTTTGYETGYTTGEPISAIVLSTTKKSGHYQQFMGAEGAVRPGHTDLVKFHQSQGYVDVRGGGRSSYRSTISDVIGGSIARIYLRETFGTIFLSSISQVGSLKSSRSLNDHFMQWLIDKETTTIPVTEIERVHAIMANAEIYTLDAEFAREAGESFAVRAGMTRHLASAILSLSGVSILSAKHIAIWAG